MNDGRSHYPLEALLALRQAEEKTAIEVLAVGQRALQEAEQRADGCRSENARRRSSLDKEIALREAAVGRGEATAASLASWQIVVGRLREALAETGKAVAQAVAEVREQAANVERARQGLAEAVRARRAIEAHREGFLRDEKAAQERAADEILDEHAARKR